MATSKKYISIIIIALLFCALSVLLFGTAKTRSSFAEVFPDSVELSPIDTKSGDTAYYYFDEPTSLHVDSIGMIVAGQNGMDFVSGETEITSRTDIAADKVYRHTEHGEHSEYIIALRNGELFTVYGGECEYFDGAQNIVDFDVENDVLYALTPTSVIKIYLDATSLNGQTAEATALHSSMHSKIVASSLTVLNGTVYIAINSSFGSKQDICSVSADGALEAVLMQSDNIICLSSDDNSNIIYALTRDELARYTLSGGFGLNKLASIKGSQFTYIYALDGYGYIYALDTLNGLHKLSADLSSDKTLIASASDAIGFFNMPSGAAAKNSTLYVADAMNGRIAVYSGNSINYSARKFVNPVSVACDSAGTVYVAYDYNKIGLFGSGEFSLDNEQTITSIEFGIIKQITVDYDKNLYVLSSTGIWKVTANSSPVLLDGGKFKAIALSVGREQLFALSESSILHYNGKTFTEYCTAKSDAFSIVVDMENSVYTLSNSYITRYESNAVNAPIDFALNVNGEPYSLGGGGGQILLSTVGNGFIDYGDALIVDTYRHRLLKADKAGNVGILGINMIDEEYDVPDIVGDVSAAYYGENIIRTALRNTEVYSLPMETQTVYTITAGRKVIVAQYDIEETREYSLVLIDDTENGKLIQGYVFKDSLSEPLPYAPPPAEIGTVQAEATPVYKWPSRYAKTVSGYSAVDKNSQFTMLDFVESYHDDYGNWWYRIELANGSEGYILANNFSVYDYQPVFINPAYNAEIISYKGSKYAVVYTVENGQYVAIANLPTGTEVEVVGAFDSSERYTKIKFIDPEHKEYGTLTGYVETVYIQYNGVNIVLIVAVIVIVVTVILASIIIYRVMRNKKKRITPDDEDNK